MSDNPFKDYLIAIGQYPLLNQEQELELGRRIKEEGDEEAREQLINSNLRLVVYIAKQYKNNYIGIEDLVQEGNLGLISALDFLTVLAIVIFLLIEFSCDSCIQY